MIPENHLAELSPTTQINLETMETMINDYKRVDPLNRTATVLRFALLGVECVVAEISWQRTADAPTHITTTPSRDGAAGW